MTEDAADLSLVEILDQLNDRKLSARELVNDCLRRIEDAEPIIRAFVTQTPHLALAAARRADDARAKGLPVGPLAGIPVAVKDLFLTRGVLTTAGSRVLASYVPTEDAAVWQRLTAAGAGLLGKTTTHEFAYGTGSSPTRNPWDIRRTPGGSSGGSAAALAMRMAPVATGTDTGGSLRIPAAACGVSTLRSAIGRLSRYGVIPLCPSFDVTGPMARRMLDVSLLMRVLAGYDVRDPGSHHAAVPDYPSAPPADLTGVRIGLPIEMSWKEVDERFADVCREALHELVTRGAKLVEIGTPALAEEVLREHDGVFDTITQVEALQIHDKLLPHSRLYTPQVRDRVQMGETVSPERYAEALQLQAQWESKWRQIMSDHRLDAIAHPTIDAPPPLIDAGREPDGPHIRLSVPWSVAGFAALSVPAGLDDRGLPVGLSLAALPEREAQLLGLGIVIDEELQSWSKQPPWLPRAAWADGGD
ncbi:aspartyl-tRNA(Asn)/glutamyl-tRNA(Gln) amidotransferase subunit A [Kribbella orskensis]|uniref:Aspartyl-tRNA(Asn)/glutamyl-tRNA(Gln) amidotransferase subunit A n=1 Tax=Kribbella orskensis TaxID=2512216 RepID=A0ABY2BU10_9ACTN|nr:MULTISPECIES: amidase [Kribbella]TCN43346.1 aspartyl-tRNA(Asn)/glutamyl-tRNA(Gln) amidotransferase subunit A [Kribbella sp. VKM Ac-2500]TCO29298.1 aspartyl-tRNA(Asn)/glutamyl-tRNA(Gln) amidotransferase subunit A [Kribbella orskensis]